MTKRRRKRHAPDQIVRKLRDADAVLNAGKQLADVLQALEISEATYHRWRNQYGGIRTQDRGNCRRGAGAAFREPFCFRCDVLSSSTSA